MGSKKGTGSKRKAHGHKSNSSEAGGASPPTARDPPFKDRDKQQPSVSPPVSGDQVQEQVGQLLSLASEMAGVSVPSAGAHIAVPFYKLAADGSTFTTLGGMNTDVNDSALQALQSSQWGKPESSKFH